MKLTFNPMVSGAFYFDRKSGLLKYYTDLASKTSKSEAIDEVMSDFADELITEKLRTKAIKEIASYKEAEPIKDLVKKAVKKKITKKKK